MIGPLLLAAAAGAAALLGALLAILPVRYSQKAMLALIGVSGGYLITWSVAHLIPYLVSQSEGLFVWVLVGYFGIYLLENVFASHAHPGETAHAHTHTLVDSWAGHTAVISPVACWAAVSGLLVHAFFDGAAIVASFSIHSNIGAMVFIAVLIHKIPEGASQTSILGAAGRNTRVTFWAAIGIALATILGGVVAGAIGAISLSWAHTILALSAGTFLFVGASNLIPATQKGESKTAAVAVLGGALLFFLVQKLLIQAGVHFHE